MKKLFITSALIVLVTSLSGQILVGNPRIPSSLHRSDHLAQYFRADAFNNLVHWQIAYRHIPGMQAAIMHDGELAWKNNYGWAYYEPPVPVTDTTLFTIASISKTITGAAIFKTIENGRMELHGDINNYLPFPVRNPYYPDDPITPAMLMTHTSSLKSYIPAVWQPPYSYNFACFTALPLGSLIQDFFDTTGIHYSMNNYLNHKPGEFGLYTDLGMAMGGYLVESIWNKPHYQFCNDSIFGPLEMTHSRFMMHEIDTMQLAMGYPPDPGIPKPAYHSVLSEYPAATLHSNVTELSHFLSMFINHGVYKNKRILDSADVDMINTVQDTISLGDPNPYYWGYSWEYISDYDSWGHGGTMTDESRGASFYNKSKHWGGIYWMNTYISANEIILWLLESARRYKPLSITSLRMNDPDQNGIYESGEIIDFFTALTNNLMIPVSNVSGIISSDDPNIEIVTSSSGYGSIGSGAAADNHSAPFRFKVKGEVLPHEAVFRMIIRSDQTNDTVVFPVYLGRAEVLLVKDNFEYTGSEKYYFDALESLGFDVRFWDGGIEGIPDSTELGNYRSIIWYTGYDYGESQFTEAIPALSNYLDHGGNLFLTGQNICDKAENSAFLENYLHATLEDTLSTAAALFGNTGDTIGDGLKISISGGDGMNNQHSPGKIDTVGGSRSIFSYPGNDHSGGVHFEGDYKTVFLSFGFESISKKETRDTLMARIFRNFRVFAGINENPGNTSGMRLTIVPNPANEKAVVKYFISASGMVTLTFYDIHGNIVMVPVKGIQLQGEQEVILNTSHLSSGMYHCVLKTSNGTSTEKLIVTR